MSAKGSPPFCKRAPLECNGVRALADSSKGALTKRELVFSKRALCVCAQEPHISATEAGL